MIVWAKKLRCSKQIEKSRLRLMKRIEAGRLTRHLYCIALPENKQNLLDIIPARELKFQHYQRIEIRVVGLAKGAEEAKELVRDMIEEVYRKTGGFAVEQYFG